MIRTENAGYWATGITLRYRPAGEGRPESWAGGFDFYDDGFLDDDVDLRQISTEGRLGTRYFVEGSPAEVALAAVIDTLIVDASRLGIRFEGTVTDKPILYYDGDGENDDWPPPEGWKHMLRMQADRIGWDSYRVDAEAS